MKLCLLSITEKNSTRSLTNTPMGYIPGVGVLPGIAPRHEEPVMTESTRTSLPIVDTGCSCCAPAADAATLTGHQSADPGGTPAGAETYQVEGMTCGHCADSAIEATGCRVLTG